MNRLGLCFWFFVSFFVCVVVVFFLHSFDNLLQNWTFFVRFRVLIFMVLGNPCS